MKKTSLSALKFLLLFAFGFLTFQWGASQCVPRSNFFWGEMLPNNGCATFASYTAFGPGEYFRTPLLLGGSYTFSTCGNQNIDTQITGFQGTETAVSIFYNDDNGPDCVGLTASVTYISTFTDYVRVGVNEFNCAPGGSASITVKVRQNNNLTFTSSDSSMCEGETRVLTATPAPITTTPQANSGAIGSFTGPGVTDSLFTAPTPSTGFSENDTLTYTFGYCDVEQVITVFSLPSASNAGPDIVTCDSMAALAADTPAVGMGSWTIVSGAGTVTSPSDPTSTITGLAPGASTVLAWTITNGPCSISTDTVIVISNGPPSAATISGDTTGCPGDSLSLTANAGLGLDYYWFDSDTGSLPIWIGETISFQISADDTLWVEAIDTSGGCSGPRTFVTVTLLSAPVASFTADTSACPTVVFTDASTDSPSSWFWDFGDGNTSSMQSPGHTYASRGPFTVSLDATNACGTSSSSLTVDIFCIAGLEELAGIASQILVYANPNNGIFNVGFTDMRAEKLVMQVVDLQGKVLLDRNLSGNKGDFTSRISLTNPSKGIYFVRIIADGKTFSRKVIVE